MRFGWCLALSLSLPVATLAACSSSFSAGPGGDAGDASTPFEAASEGSPGDGTIPVDGGHADADATSDGASSETSSSGGGEGGGSDAAEAGCSGLVCGGECVPSNDVHNCGACGHDCTNLPHVSGAVSCSAAGACVFPVSSCAPGWTQCLSNPDLGCETNITTTANCGSCGNMCSGGTPSCSGSGTTYGCVSGCPLADPTLCSGTCVDTTSNAQDCSTCGNVCATSEPHAQPTCVSSACSFSCNTGYPLCGGACVDTTNDDANCGTCGNKCGGGTHCVSSKCQCPVGLSDCSGSCVDTSQTVQDCGACGHDCYGGACTSGACQPWVVVKAPTTQGVGPIAADARYFVWGDTLGSNSVLDVPLTGGPAVSIHSPGAPVTAVAVGSGHVQFVEYSSTLQAPALWDGLAGQASSAAVLTGVGSVTDGPVFDPGWLNSYMVQGGASAGSTSFSVLQCPVGGACTSLADPVMASSTNGVRIRPTSTAVFLLNMVQNGIGTLWRQTPGSPATTLESPTSANDLAVDSANVYWSAQAITGPTGPYTSTVYAESLGSSGGSPKTLITLPGYIAHLVADGTNVYFTVSSSVTTTDAASIQYIPIAGAATTKTLYSKPVTSAGVVGGAGALYWVESDGSTVDGVRFP
jgi:hypothetical protein